MLGPPVSPVVSAGRQKPIHGISFKTADQIAQKIGIPVDSLNRP
jgi:hypothetical protein